MKRPASIRRLLWIAAGLPFLAAGGLAGWLSLQTMQTWQELGGRLAPDGNLEMLNLIPEQTTRMGLVTGETSLVLFLGLTAYAVRTFTYPIKTIPFFEKRAQVWDERDAVIRQAVAEAKKDVEVREIDSYMGVLELHPEPNWVNNCAAEFYGLETIRSTLPWN